LAYKHTEIEQRNFTECPRACQATTVLAECSFYCFIIAKLHQFQVTHTEKYAS